MTHLETELSKIKDNTLEMMGIVQNQLKKGAQALFTSNKEMALEVMHNEKRVNGYELLIDNSCENVIACFNPMANDLRFVLATLKINYHLERIGDNADGISRNVLDLKEQWDETLIEKLESVRAFDIVVDMLENVIDAYKNEDTAIVRKVFEKDKKVDQITHHALTTIAEYLRGNQSNVEQDLYLLLIHRKLERIGDLIKNIAEEIIFYLEAKVLKHKKEKIIEQ
jgi:phosphate transport system protein